MKFVQPAVLILAMAFAANTCLPRTRHQRKPLTPQRQKMKDCNLQASDKKGDEAQGVHEHLPEGQERATRCCTSRTGESR